MSSPPAKRSVSNASFSAAAAWAVSLASTPFSTIRSEPTFTPSGAPSLSNAMRCPVPATLAVRTPRSRSITKRLTTTFSESALKESPPLVDTQSAEKVRGSWEEEERRLIAAGWEPKERGGLLIWANPETGFYCSQEVALYRLEAREAANIRTFATQKSARV